MGQPQSPAVVPANEKFRQPRSDATGDPAFGEEAGSRDQVGRWRRWMLMQCWSPALNPLKIPRPSTFLASG